MENEIALEETVPTEQNEKELPVEDVKAMQANGNSIEEIPSNITDVKIPVKYNKQHIELSVEQASELAQKGMKFDDMRSVMDKLAYLSASTGKSAEKLIDALLEKNEKELSDRARELAGDDEVLFSKLLALEHSKNKKAFERALNTQKELKREKENLDNERIAEQFIELNKEFPEIDNVNAIPKQTFEIAVNNGISLLDAYLRYKHREDIRVKTAQQEQKLAAQSSVGSQRSSVLTENNLEDAFAKGVWSRN